MLRAVVDTNVFIAGLLNGHALLVTENVADFKKPARELGFRVVRPRRFLEILEEVEA